MENINNMIPNDIRMGIYKITAPDGYYYIGSSSNFIRRFKGHFYDLKHNTHHTQLFQRKYNAHPNWIWVCELLEQVTNENILLEAEQRHLDQNINSVLCMNPNPVAGRPPSQKGKKRSVQQCKAMSLARKGKLRGPLAPEDKIRIGTKISASLKGRKRPNISIALKNRIRKPETFAKISAALKGRKLTPESIIKRQATRAANKAKESYLC